METNLMQFGVIFAVIAYAALSGFPQTEVETDRIQFDYYSDQVKWIRQVRGWDESKRIELLSSESSNEVITSAWELARIHHGKDSEKQNENWNLSWFCGIIEGRFSIVCPKIWRRAVIRGFFSADGFQVRDFESLVASVDDITWNDELELWHPAEVSLSKDMESISLTYEGKSCVIPQPILDGPCRSGGAIACDLTNEFCFIMFYEKDFCRQTQLACIRLSDVTNELVWKQPVWSTGPTAGTGFRPDDNVQSWQNYCTIMTDTANVYVFGVSQNCVSLEVFDLRAGNRILSFVSKW